MLSDWAKYHDTVLFHDYILLGLLAAHVSANSPKRGMLHGWLQASAAQGHDHWASHIRAGNKCSRPVGQVPSSQVQSAATRRDGEAWELNTLVLQGPLPWSPQLADMQDSYNTLVDIHLMASAQTCITLSA